MSARSFTLFLACLLLFVGPAAVCEEVNRPSLPAPEQPFRGKIGLTFKDSEPVKPELEVPSDLGLKDPPNILLVLIDDCGYGQMGTFSGGIPTPNMDRVVNNGLLYTFDDADAEDRHKTRYFEMLGNQGIYHDGWMASALRGDPWLSESPPIDLLNMPWELYNVEEDFTQANNLAKDNPEKLDEMVKLFFAEASKFNVLPLDGRKTARLDVSNRPSLIQGRTKFTYPNLLRLPEGASPDLKHKSHTITADVDIPEAGAEGMLFTQGGPLRRLRPHDQRRQTRLPLQPSRRRAVHRRIR